MWWIPVEPDWGFRTSQTTAKLEICWSLANKVTHVESNTKPLLISAEAPKITKWCPFSLCTSTHSKKDIFTRYLKRLKGGQYFPYLVAFPKGRRIHNPHEKVLVNPSTFGRIEVQGSCKCGDLSIFQAGRYLTSTASVR